MASRIPRVPLITYSFRQTQPRVPLIPATHAPRVPLRFASCAIALYWIGAWVWVWFRVMGCARAGARGS